MAEEKIAIQIEIGGTEKTLSSLKQIKQARKDLTEAALLGDEKAVKSLKILEDKFGDLQDAAKTVRGDGLEPLKNSFNLFKEGISNLDLGKIGTAFKGLGAAMKAVPIFLIVEGVMALVNNFDELSKGSGLLGKALRAIGDLLGWIKDGIYAVTDALGITNSELDKMGEAVKTNADKAREALSLQNAEYDRQIAVAKAAGKSTVELEKAKQQAIIDTNVAIVKQIEAFVRAGGVLDEEKQKLLTGSLEAIKNAKVQEYVIEAGHQKNLTALYKAAADERARIKSLEFESNKQFLADEFDAQIEQLNAIEAEKDRLKREELDKDAALDAERLNMSLWKWSVEKEQRDKDTAEKEAAAQKEKELKQQTADFYVGATKQSLEASQQITAIYFEWQLRQAQNDSKRQLEIRKRQFQVEKAFKVAMIVIDTVLGGIKAISQNPPPNPIGIISAALIGVAGTLATIKVLSTKFDAGGASGSIGDTTGGISAGATAPAVQQPNNTVTQLDEVTGKKKEESQPVVKAIVVESDVTEKQKNVKKIEETATF
jgi:hypothetical protein